MADERPTVSVVIAAYNAERWIAEAIQRVLGQDYPVLEVIVVDDGSTDATREAIAPFREPVRYVFQENAGSAAARNHGIRLARGELVAFLDADDRWLPGKLAAQVDPDCGWCYTDAWLVDASTQSKKVRLSQLAAIPEGWVLEALLLSNFVPFSSALVRREALDAVGGFREGPDRRISEAWEVWTLEHDAFWAEHVRQVLRRFGMTNVHLLHVPLRDYGAFHWYDVPLEKLPACFSLVLCDGQPGGRYGLLPMLGPDSALRLLFSWMTPGGRMSGPLQPGGRPNSVAR